MSPAVEWSAPRTRAQAARCAGRLGLRRGAVHVHSSSWSHSPHGSCPCERSQARAPIACPAASLSHGRRRSTSGRTGALLYTYPNTRSRVVRDEFLERDETESAGTEKAHRVNGLTVRPYNYRYTKTVGGVFRVIVWFLSRRPGNLHSNVRGSLMKRKGAASGTLTCVVPS